MSSSVERLGFTCVEAGWLLSLTESRVRGLLRMGKLTYVVQPRLIEPVTVWFSSPRDGRDLRVLAFDALLAGNLKAPRPEARYGKPTSLMAGLLPLMAERNGYSVPKTVD